MSKEDFMVTHDLTGFAVISDTKTGEDFNTYSKDETYAEYALDVLARRNGARPTKYKQWKVLRDAGLT